MKQKLKNKQPGFTAIDLIVVTAILALLSSIVLTNARQARMQANDLNRYTAAITMQKALELHFQDKGYYPPAGAHAWGQNGQGSAVYETDPEWENQVIPSLSGYMSGIPRHGRSFTNYTVVGEDEAEWDSWTYPGGQRFIYAVVNTKWLLTLWPQGQTSRYVCLPAGSYMLFANLDKSPHKNTRFVDPNYYNFVLYGGNGIIDPYPNQLNCP